MYSVLKNGVTMPMEGFGVLQLKDPAICKACVGEALRVGYRLIPGSSVKEHIRENMDIWDFQLSDADMKAIEQFDQKSSEIVDFHTACTAKWLNEWGIHE